MRAISDYLADKFRALGLPAIADHRLEGGRQVIKFADGIVPGDGTKIYVGPFASDAEIESAARKAFNMTDDNIETAAPAAAEPVQAGISPLPPVTPVTAAPAPAVARRAPPATPGDHATSIRDLMEQHVQNMARIADASVETLRISLERQAHALSEAPKRVAQKIDGQTEDFIAIMREFGGNDLGV